MKPSPETILKVLPQVRDFASFTSLLLRDALGWPVPHDIDDPDDLTFHWSEEDLRAQGLDRHLREGSVLQLQNLVPRQPWGIFLVEFSRPDVFNRGRGMTGVLRRVLRGLVSSARRRSNLPSWQREDLLFICTCGWTQYAFVHFSKSGEGGAARLSTFGWSADAAARTRTVVTHNLPHLAWPGDPADHAGWRAAWGRAWDKEALTKQFYEVFAGNEKKGRHGVYQILRDDLRNHNKLTDAEAGEHALLILNRLLFLYFIQRKGWLAGDTAFLRNGFRPYEARRKDTDFYREKRDAKTLPYTTGFLSGLFARLSVEDHADPRFRGVPFLNGGLFQPDDGDADLKITNATFAAIFDELLERFNFTVTEDTPLDVEVAIDPEMLGKIFECLALRQEKGEGPLAEAGDTTDRTLSKQKLTGSYYTPRAIVHFMCREALKEHLRTAWHGAAPETADAAMNGTLSRLMETPFPDPPTEQDRDDIRGLVPSAVAPALRSALEELRVVDPAVGSGAFLVGMLHEVVRLRGLLDLHLDGVRKVARRNYVHDLKKAVIEHTLFGVDIQEQAVRLCELRLWLSLVVDYQLPDGATDHPAEMVRHIPTLPNLSYRIVRGDSLLERLFGHAVQIEVLSRDPRSREVIQELKKEKETFFALRDPAEKRRRELIILEKQVRLAELLIEEKTRYLDEQIRVVQDMFDSEKSACDRRNEQAQRDLVLLWRGLKDRVHRAGEKVRSLLNEPCMLPHENLLRLRNKYFDATEYATFFWQVDFAEVFEEKNGFDVVIANPPYIRQERLKDLQPFLKPLFPEVAEKSVDAYIYFIEQGRRCTRPDGILCYITSSTWTKTAQGAALRKHLGAKTSLLQYIDFGDLQVFDGVTTYCAIILLRRTLPKPIHKIVGKRVTSLERERLRADLLAEGVRINQKDIASALLIEDVESSRVKSKVINTGVPLRKLLRAPVYRGVTTGCNKAFVIDEQTREAIVGVDKKSAEIIKPYIEGKHISRWSANWRNRWIIFCRQGSVEISSYPAILHHLRGYRKRLEPRPSNYDPKSTGDWKGRKPGSYKWFEIQDTVAYHGWFEQPKILSTKVSRRMSFAFDDSGLYSSNTSYILPIDNGDKWLVAVLNSSVMGFLARSLFVAKSGGFFEIQPTALSELPITRPSTVDRRKLSTLADALSEEECPNRFELEAEVNDRVAHLYGLTEEEKKIVHSILPAENSGEREDDGGDDDD